jgi:hypothetical protein
MNGPDLAIWRDAETIDETLRIRPPDLETLDRIRVRPRHFSIVTLHNHMEKSEPVVFRDCNVSFQKSNERDAARTLIELILAGFPKDQRARTKTGREARLRLLETP